MAESVDCSDFCRLCLVKEQVNTPIFEELGDLQQIYIKITACLPIKVSLEDPLPKRICDECSYKLDQQYNFWNTSINAEKQLRQWLGLPEEPPTKSENVSGKIKREKDNYDSPSKRPRRNARRKAAQHVRQAAAAAIAASDSGPGEDMDLDAFTKEENDSDHDFHDNNESMEDTTYTNVGLDSEEHGSEAGPSGLQKGAVTSTNSGTDAGGTGNNAVQEIEQDFVGGAEIIREEEVFKLKHSGYHCNICDKRFFQKELCRRHYLRMHIDSAGYPCEVCNKIFKYKWNLITHTKLHDLNRQKYTCEICNREYATPQSYKMHKNRHLKNYSFKCNQCGKGFYQKAELKIHTDAEHNAIRYQCQMCKKTFCSKGYLSIHYRSHDPNYVPPELKCHICGKTYHSTDLFRRHVKAHEGFPCELCGKTLTSQISLKNHILIHRGEKPLSCNVCGKRFNKRAILKVHMRIHTNEKPYECKECGKRFAQRSPLVIHLRYHTGERPYQCQHCGEAFVSNTCLKAHIKKNHNYYPNM